MRPLQKKMNVPSNCTSKDTTGSKNGPSDPPLGIPLKEAHEEEKTNKVPGGHGMRSGTVEGVWLTVRQWQMGGEMVQGGQRVKPPGPSMKARRDRSEKGKLHALGGRVRKSSRRRKKATNEICRQEQSTVGDQLIQRSSF